MSVVRKCPKCNGTGYLQFNPNNPYATAENKSPLWQCDICVSGVIYGDHKVTSISPLEFHSELLDDDEPYELTDNERQIMDKATMQSIDILPDPIIEQQAQTIKELQARANSRELMIQNQHEEIMRLMTARKELQAQVERLKKDRDRVLVLATKWCRVGHQDWEELLTYSIEPDTPEQSLTTHDNEVIERCAEIEVDGSPRYFHADSYEYRAGFQEGIHYMRKAIRSLKTEQTDEECEK